MGSNRNNTINLTQQVDIQPERGRIDFLPDKYSVFSAGLYALQGLLRQVVGFFTLTEEDRLKAGIYMGGGERDD
jgi:hypothetical protein